MDYRNPLSSFEQIMFSGKAFSPFEVGFTYRILDVGIWSGLLMRTQRGSPTCKATNNGHFSSPPSEHSLLSSACTTK